MPHFKQIQILVEFYNASMDDAVKVKCIGTLECLAQCSEAVEANNVTVVSSFFPPAIYLILYD